MNKTQILTYILSNSYDLKNIRGMIYCRESCFDCDVSEDCDSLFGDDVANYKEERYERFKKKHPEYFI